MNQVDTTLSYVTKGFPVLPLCWPVRGNCGCGRKHTDRAIGKVPLTTNGLKNATLTQLGVKEYWKRWPLANIGVVIPAGYFVVDVDIDHDGLFSLGRVQEVIGALPETLQITTGSGGLHFWYKTDKPIRNTARLAGYDGIDIRGVGGYVVAPPSLHVSGHRYEVSPIWGGEIMPAPAALVELCLKPLNNNKPGVTRPDNNRYYLEGERNDRLTRDAGAMRHRGLSEQAIYAALTITNDERCSPPLPDKEVLAIAQSIGRYHAEAEGRPRFKGMI